MAPFKSSRLYFASPVLIESIANELALAFAAEGYDVDHQPIVTGGWDISIGKGGTFESILGLKSALKVAITPQGENILAETGVGIFGQQAIPTFISVFIFLSVLIPQVWGLIQQLQLDTRTLDMIGESIKRHSEENDGSDNNKKVTTITICKECGNPLSDTAKFCSACGAKTAE